MLLKAMRACSLSSLTLASAVGWTVRGSRVMVCPTSPATPRRRPVAVEAGNLCRWDLMLATQRRRQAQPRREVQVPHQTVPVKRLLGPIPVFSLSLPMSRSWKRCERRWCCSMRLLRSTGGTTSPSSRMALAEANSCIRKWHRARPVAERARLTSRHRWSPSTPLFLLRRLRETTTATCAVPSVLCPRLLPAPCASSTVCTRATRKFSPASSLCKLQMTLHPCT
mmetsp:Transcript_6992/g.24877  ORF Transcript_6992/g.24877 Transcript_6992/m.24877 type:complete len:224 (-) Transcript_6992:534-1205(-)